LDELKIDEANELDPTGLLEDEVTLLSKCEGQKDDFHGVEAGTETCTKDLESDIENFREKGVFESPLSLKH
jgi:hypothetical protein